MNQTELLALAQQYMVPQALIVVVALLVIGYFLKKTPIIKDWLIPWILVCVGIILAWGVLEAITIQATIQGILAAGVATLTHQLWKQTIDKRNEQGE